MEKIIKKALKVMEDSFEGGGEKINTSGLVMDYCRLQLGAEKDEVFAVLFMDNSLRLLKFERFFTGTVNQSAVYMRPIARRMLELNACKMILVHNHPSGITKPSESDIKLTRDFKKVFDALDCQIVDHIIVSALEVTSMANSGLI